MKKYEIIKNTRNISYKDMEEIKEGCTLDQAEQDPECLESFGSKEEALEALAKYESDIYRYTSPSGAMFEVTEYYVEENEYDEDGDLVSSGNVWGFSEMPEVEY